DDEAVLRLGIVDGVPADDVETAAAGDLASAAKDVREKLERERVARPRRDVERDHRTSAHRVDVARRVRGGDAAPREGAVHERGEEVDGEDQRIVAVEL